MKRSIQEIIELLVLGLIALLVGTGLLWVVGWTFGGVGYLLKLLAGLIWSLLRFVVPNAMVGAAVYALVRLLQGQRTERPDTAATTHGSTTASKTVDTAPARTGTPPATKPASPPPAAEATTTKAVEPESQRAAVVEEAVQDADTAERDRTRDRTGQGSQSTPEPASEDDGEQDDEGDSGSLGEDADEDARR
jgi:uncharacterized membrane protein